MSQTKEERKTPLWKRCLFSDTVLGLPLSKKITYIALLTAFTVIANTFFEMKFFSVQFSVTIFVSVLAGIFLGSAFGFTACFLGDLIGFLLHPFGAYLPWIGISTGLMAVFGALLYGRIPWKSRTGKIMKLLFVNLAIFVVCTAGITSITLNKVWFSSLTYPQYLVERLFVEGQIWNTLLNALLLFVLLPMIERVKLFRKS